jgi:hypothetical protein
MLEHYTTAAPTARSTAESVGANIHRYPMPLASSECQASLHWSIVTRAHVSRQVYNLCPKTERRYDHEVPNLFADMLYRG